MPSRIPKAPRTTSIVAAILLCLPVLAAGQGTVTPTPYQTVLDASGNPVSGACIWTYVAGTSTPVSTFTDSTLVTPNTNPIKASTAGRFQAWLTPGASYKYIFESSCTSPAHGTVIITVDNIIGVAANTQAGDVTGTAGVSLAAGKVVYLSAADGKWYLADKSAAATSLSTDLGMTPSAISSGLTGTIRLVGTVSGLAGLTAGTDYYVGTAGALQTTPADFSRLVGRADSTTSIILADPAAKVSKTIVLTNVVNVSVTNTVTPTQVFNFAVPANTLGTYRALRLTLVGRYANNSGGASNLLVDLSYGGQLLATGVARTMATTSDGPFALQTTITGLGATNSQGVVSIFTLVPSAATIGTTWGAETAVGAHTAGLTVDSTVAQSLIVQVTHSVANIAIQFQMYAAIVEVIGQ